MESRKASSGNILVILLVIVVLVIALGVIAFKVILPKFTSQLGSQVASQAIQMAVDQIKKMDFSKAETVEINQQLPNPKLSVVSVGFNQGKLTIDGETPGNAVTGEIKYLGQKPQIGTGQLKGLDAVTIQSSDQMGEDTTIHLPTNQPLNLQVGIGLAIATIDLRNLAINEASIAAGAGEITVVPPQNTSSTLSLAAGAGTLKVGTHKENGVKVTAASGMPWNNLELDQARYAKIKGGFKSTNYETANVKTDIVVGQTGNLLIGDLK